MIKKGKIMIGFLSIAIFTIGSFAYAQSFDTDLENLKEELEQRGLDDFTRVYHEKVKIFGAWNQIKDNGAPLAHVDIGIIDTGVDARNEEFAAGVNFSDRTRFFTPQLLRDRSRLRGGHGTKVAGIIGANNISATTAYRFPHMNGIVSGVPVDYTFHLGDMRSAQPFIKWFGVLRFHPFLPAKFSAALKAMPEKSVVNMSFGFAKCSVVSNADSCVKDEDFEDYKDYYLEGIDARADILFVMSAGADDVDAKDHLPGGGVSAANVITVASVNLDDSLGIDTNFNTVNIAAPGISIYAPTKINEGNAELGGIDEEVNYTTTFTGTSGAAPFVTGVAGLIKAIQPGFTPERIKSVLTNSADPIKTGEPQKTMGNACHSDPDIISQQKTGATACRLNAESAVKTVTPFYNYNVDFVSVDGNTPSSLGCNTNRQGQSVSFFDDFDDGSTNTGCTAVFSQFGTFGEEAGHLTLNSNDAVSSIGFRVHTATLQTPFQEGGGNSQIEVSFKPDTPFGASENGFSNYGFFLRENVPSDIPALSIQVGSIEGRTFLNAIQFPEVITRQIFLSLSDLENLVLRIELNDTSNLATPLFSIDNGSTFIPFRNPDNTIFRVPAFRESSDAHLQVFGSLFLPQTPAQTQSQLLLPQNLPFTPVIVE